MLDIRTLLIVVSALSILSAVVIYALYRFRLPVQGPSWWAGASLMLAVGLSMTAARGLIPLFLSVVVANCFVLWFYVLTINGMHLFLGRRPFLNTPRLAVAALLTLAYALYMHWFSAVAPDLNARIIATSLLAGTLALYLGVILLRDRHRMFGAIFCAGWMIAHSIGDVVRIAMVMTTPELGNFLRSGPVNAYYIAFAILALLGMAFGMVLMISEELNDRVLRQNDVLEENIRLRDEMEAITQHDLKSPIMPIVSLSELLLTTPKLPDEAAVYAREIRRAAQDALDTLNRSLDLYKLENGRYSLDLEPVDVKALVRELLNQMDPRAGGGRASVTMNINGKPFDSDETCVLYADGVLLRTMLSNLLQNAFEATQGEGLVEVDLASSTEGMVLAVVNDGAVDPSLREKFFQKFSTLGKKTGTGLGTYSSRLIAEAHGGSVQVDFSQPDKTTVQVTLPSSSTTQPR